MNVLLRGLMSSDASTNRPLLSLILLGIFDFVCVLEAGDLYKDRHFVAGTWWLTAGVTFSVIGYYWSQIKQGLGNRLATTGHWLQSNHAPVASASRLKIISAHWGVEGAPGGDPDKVDCLLEKQTGNLFAELVGLDLFHGSQPVPGPRRLKVEYSFDGRKDTVVRREGEFLMLPEDPFLKERLESCQQRASELERLKAEAEKGRLPIYPQPVFTLEKVFPEGPATNPTVTLKNKVRLILTNNLGQDVCVWTPLWASTEVQAEGSPPGSTVQLATKRGWEFDDWEDERTCVTVPSGRSFRTYVALRPASGRSIWERMRVGDWLGAALFPVKIGGALYEIPIEIGKRQ